MNADPAATTDAATTAGPAESAIDRGRIIRALETQLTRIPATVRPYEHAVTAYRLGLAYAESATREDDLRTALACYDLAATGLDPVAYPVERARVLNAAAAAHRSLGAVATAARLFTQAADLLAGSGNDEERGATLNNMAVAWMDLGDGSAALAASAEALELLGHVGTDSSRAWVTAMLTRGQIRSKIGGRTSLLEAVADFDVALAGLDPGAAPYQWGMLHHSRGMALSALADGDANGGAEHLRRARHAFEMALSVFTRTELPFQHAVTKYNLGRVDRRSAALARGAARILILRRALACLEDSVAGLDPRLQPDPWGSALAELSATHEELETECPGCSRAEHFASLLAASPDAEQMSWLRERLVCTLARSDPMAAATLLEMAEASARGAFDDVRRYISAELTIAIELPGEALSAVLQARATAHTRLVGPPQDNADRALDQAIGDALGGPQRMFVRDFLYARGWNRP
ncbi:MAG: hypothetical protein NVS3B12_14970 [Acidimicrobiales bacterium]